MINRKTKPSMQITLLFGSQAAKKRDGNGTIHKTNDLGFLDEQLTKQNDSHGIDYSRNPLFLSTVENHSIATHSIACSLLRTPISDEHYFDDH